MLTTIQQNITAIRESLPQQVTLVAVSKFHPAEQIMEAYETGQRVFGESRVQELLPKEEALPKDIVWHFIGHLQTNKVRQLMGRCSLIESVDSIKLLECIDAESVRAGVTTRVLLQVNVTDDENKTGFDRCELLQYITSGCYKTLKATQLCGVMGMASNTDDTERIEADFKAIRATYDAIKASAPELTQFGTVSMGMSDDRNIAIACGSTMVRIGTDIFGHRNY